MRNGGQVAAAAGLLCLCADLAFAMVPLPECMGSNLAPEEAEYIEYSPAWAQGGFVYYQLTSRASDRTTFVLDDCTGGRRLTMQPAGWSAPDFETRSAGQVRLHDTIATALESAKGYSMEQIRALARGAGARASLAAAKYESCACKVRG